MLPDKHLGFRRYYDLLPPEVHACGDIWRGLPSGGLLGSRPIAGLVVTPACDLSARKAETITYLPIIPVRSYFSTLGALPEIYRRVHGNLKAGQLQLDTPWKENSFVPPKQHLVDAAIGAIETHLSAKPRGVTEITALKRASAGLRIASAIADPELSEVTADDLGTAFGNDWQKTKERIATNAFGAHLHFLPSDDQDPAYSGLPSHSVVLFRYPLTASIEIFDLAQQSTESFWVRAVTQAASFLPAATSFSGARPLKVLSLRAEFLHDLLTRYVAVYNRIGSPDFSKYSINAICNQMDSL
jgi:hypothetical protein